MVEEGGREREGEREEGEREGGGERGREERDGGRKGGREEEKEGSKGGGRRAEGSTHIRNHNLIVSTIRELQLGDGVIWGQWGRGKGQRLML